MTSNHHLAQIGSLGASGKASSLTSRTVLVRIAHGSRRCQTLRASLASSRMDHHRGSSPGTSLLRVTADRVGRGR